MTECGLSVGTDMIAVIQYEMQWSSPSSSLTTHNVIAVWKVAENTYARVGAAGHDQAAQEEFLTALRTVVFAPR
jgi:hypothetical protein